MIERKQVVLIVSIAVVLFLIGTSVASDGGNPFDNVWNAFYGLESRIEALEDQSIPQGFVSTPAYDSGWINIGKTQTLTLTHNLNTTKLLVYVMGNEPIPDPYTPHGINQRAYGGDDGWGLWWLNLENTTIQVFRGTDRYSEQVRVIMWRIPEPPP